MATLNPHTMTAAEIAEQATTAQIVDGIDRALNGLLAETGRAGWSELHAKLNEALRIKRAGRRTVAAPAPRYRGRHASPRMAFNGITADGLASYGGPSGLTYPGWIAPEYSR